MAENDELKLKKDEALLEEYKVVYQLLTNSESILVSWERTYLVTNGFILAAATSLIIKQAHTDEFSVIIIVMFIFSIIACLFWHVLAKRTYLFIQARTTRLGQIEKLLQKLHNDERLFNLSNVVDEQARSGTGFIGKISANKLRTYYPVFLAVMNFVICVSFTI